MARLGLAPGVAPAPGRTALMAAAKQVSHLHDECTVTRMILIDASQLRARGLEAFHGHGLVENRIDLSDLNRDDARAVLAVCEPSYPHATSQADGHTGRLAVLDVACADSSIKWVWWARVCAACRDEASYDEKAEHERMRRSAIWLFLTCRVLVLSRAGDETLAPPQALAEMWLATQAATADGMRECRPGRERCVSILLTPATSAPEEEHEGRATVHTAPLVIKVSAPEHTLSSFRQQVEEQLHGWAGRSLLEAYLALRPQAGFAFDEDDDFERTGVLSHLLLLDEHIRETSARVSAGRPPPAWRTRTAISLDATAVGACAEDLGICYGDNDLHGRVLVWHESPEPGSPVRGSGSPVPSPSLVRRPATSTTHRRWDAEETRAPVVRRRARSQEIELSADEPSNINEEHHVGDEHQASVTSLEPRDALTRSLKMLNSRLVEVRRKDEYAQKQLAMAMVRRTTTGEDSYASPLLKKLTRAAAKVMGMNRAARAEGVASRKVAMLRGMHACRGKEESYRDLATALNEPAQAVIRASAERRRLFRQLQALQEQSALLSDEARMVEVAAMRKRVQELHLTHEAAVLSGDETYADVTCEIGALSKCVSAPAAVAAQIASEFGGSVDEAIESTSETLRTKETMLRELGQTYERARSATVEAAREWTDATSEYKQSKREQEDAMKEELELVRSA